MLVTFCYHFISNNNTIISTDSVIVTGARVDADQGSVRRSIVTPHHCRPKLARRSNGMPTKSLQEFKIFVGIHLIDVQALDDDGVE